MFSLVFVCMFVSRIMQNYSPDFTQFGGKAPHGPLKKPLHFNGTIIRITLCYRLGLGHGYGCVTG